MNVIIIQLVMLCSLYNIQQSLKVVYNVYQTLVGIRSLKNHNYRGTQRLPARGEDIICNIPSSMI